MEDPGGVGSKNKGDLRRGEMGEVKRVERGLNHNVVEAEPSHELSRGLIRRRRSDVTAEGRVEVLNDSEFPVGLSGENISSGWLLLASSAS